MTIPAPTHHSIKKKQVGGDVEVQEMCFYITSEFQVDFLKSYFNGGFSNFGLKGLLV